MVSGLLVCAAVAQVVPPSVLYCQLVTAEPPLSGSLTVRVSDRSARLTPVMDGWAGVVTGVPLIGADAVPLPCALTARTVTAYDVPLVSPATWNVPSIEPVLTQGPVPSSWYSYRMTASPPFPPGVKATCSVVLPAVTAEMA